MAARILTAAERAFAYRVFGNSLNYDAVSVSDLSPGGQVVTAHFNGAFTIHWTKDFVDIMSGRRPEGDVHP